jgi:hypothetical protein
MLIYLAILGIVLLIFIKKIENFEEKKRGILVLYGESFRDGDMGSRVRDCEECVNTQKLASQSHNDLIQFLKERYDITMDVLINTYDTKHKDLLKGFYNSPDIYFHEELMGSEKICQDAIDKVDHTKYDFILVSRPDIFIKPHFYTIFDPYWTKIKFLSLTAYDPRLRGFTNNKNGIYYPDINGLIMFIPQEYFYTLPMMNSEHQAWYHYMEKYQLTDKDMGFMVNYEFNPNSANMMNDYYKMVGRPESKIPMDTQQRINQSLIGTKLADIK